MAGKVFLPLCAVGQMKIDFIRAQLEGLEERNRERLEKRRRPLLEHLERKKMGTVRVNEKAVRVDIPRRRKG